MNERIARLTPHQPEWVVDSIIALAVAAIAVVLALAAHIVLFRILNRIARASESASDDLLVARLMWPTRYSFVALGLVLVARETPLLDGLWQKVAGFVMPALLGWVALAITRALIEAMELRADISVPDNLRARRTRTRLAIFGRIASFIIVFLTVGLMLLSIPGVREIGVTLMASAGLAGLAVGAAAQPALKSLIGGLQLALTEPIRLGDLVVIDGDSGRVEDIHMTYVVVRTADERRIIVPATRFLDTTFQNWTRVTGGITGSVLLPVKPGFAFAPIREAFLARLAAHPDWDRRTGALHVAEARVGSVDLRLAMSAAEPAALDRLRLAMREAMLDWLREAMPDALCDEV